MCKPHWRQYVTALRKAALARKALALEVAEVTPAEPEPAASGAPTITPANMATALRAHVAKAPKVAAKAPAKKPAAKAAKS